MNGRIQQVIVEEWCDVLELEDIEPDANFFGSGGNSFLALMFIAQIEERLGIQLPLEVLFADGSLSAVIEACTEAAA